MQKFTKFGFSKWPILKTIFQIMLEIKLDLYFITLNSCAKDHSNPLTRFQVISWKCKNSWNLIFRNGLSPKLFFRSCWKWHLTCILLYLTAVQNIIQIHWHIFKLSVGNVKIHKIWFFKVAYLENYFSDHAGNQTWPVFYCS